MSDAACRVDTIDGAFFVKAVANRPGGRLDSLRREAAINPYVRPLSPALRWHLEDEAWSVLVFDWVQGRTSDYKPGSADLPAILDVVSRIGQLPIPDIAKGWTETRWDRFLADPEQVPLLRGDTLLYTDLNQDNLMIATVPDAPQRVWAVDWSWPTVGAAFIDPACLVIQLLADGHTPQSAEAWAQHCPAWTNADPSAIDAFAVAAHRMYQHRTQQHPRATWLHQTATAISAWLTHRAIVRVP